MYCSSGPQSCGSERNGHLHSDIGATARTTTAQTAPAPSRGRPYQSPGLSAGLMTTCAHHSSGKSQAPLTSTRPPFVVGVLSRRFDLQRQHTAQHSCMAQHPPPHVYCKHSTAGCATPHHAVVHVPAACDTTPRPPYRTVPGPARTGRAGARWAGPDPATGRQPCRAALCSTQPSRAVPCST